MSIKIRLMSVSDIDAVVSLCNEVQSIHITFSPDIFKPLEKDKLSEWFKNMLDENDAFIFIARRDDTVIGYLLLKRIVRPEHFFCFDRTFIEVDQISIKESERGSGVGRSLIEAAKQFTRDQGLKRMELSVWSLNEKAKDAFEALGFAAYMERMAISCE